MNENLNNCCLYNTFPSCSFYISSRFENWPSTVVNISDLKDSAIGYLAEIGVISNSNQGTYEISEYKLIQNRLARYIDIEKPFLKICTYRLAAHRVNELSLSSSIVLMYFLNNSSGPLHRYTFGFGWKDSAYCAHADHKRKIEEPERKKRKRNHSMNNRIAPIYFFNHLIDFPYGARLCPKHMKKIYSLIEAQQSLADELDTFSNTQSYEIKADRENNLEQVNMLLTSLGQSPVKSQVTVPLNEQAPGSVRRLVAKFRQSVSAYASSVAHSLAPGQEEQLLEIANLQEITERRSSTNIKSSENVIDEQYLNFLIQMYQSCEEKCFSYNEQVRVLTLIPESWKLTSKMIEEKFNCTRHAVKTARLLRKMSNTPLHIDPTPPKIRQRIDPSKLDYFISWMLYSEFLINIPWGSTNFKLDDGQVIEIPKQILQAQQAQIIFSYQQHCKIVGIEPLSDRILYSILSSLNFNNQKFISGIDEFVKFASEAWLTLDKIIRQLSITYTMINQFLDSIEKCKIYLKTKYGCQCGENAQSTTHCSIFALSQQDNPFYSQLCDHDHSIQCADCHSIFLLFDEIENHINMINDQELREELLYDFGISWNSIFELMAHKVRTAQQEQQKQKYVENMDEQTAFLTVDWAQKILPQQFREGQSSYFGKKGMSVLVGSFLFKMPSKNEFTSRTYMIALTSCAQTELDTLSCGQVILKEFIDDYPHITKLIKRSDNASVLSGQYTIQFERKITDDLGVRLLIRDYSEVQSGKSICDRISGTAKLRLRSFINAGNNVLSAPDIKKGFEYSGGIKNLKVAVAEVFDVKSETSLPRVPELNSIRNIVYDDNNFIIRKATGVGLGKPIKYEDFVLSLNVRLIESFDKYDYYHGDSNNKSSIKRTDRSMKTFLFCPNESCVSTFESEQELNDHIVIDIHTNTQSSLRTNDRVKLMLFEKMRNLNTTSIIAQPITTASTPISIPRHSKPFLIQGWALRTRKPYKPIDKEVKNFIKSIFEEEKINGRKVPIDEYITRIRTARNPDSTKRFNTSQYLTHSQIQNQIRILSSSSKSKLNSHNKNASTVSSVQINSSTQSQHSITNDLLSTNDQFDATLLDEDDDKAIESLLELENLRNTIIDTFS